MYVCMCVYPEPVKIRNVLFLICCFFSCFYPTNPPPPMSDHTGDFVKDLVGDPIAAMNPGASPA